MAHFGLSFQTPTAALKWPSSWLLRRLEKRNSPIEGMGLGAYRLRVHFVRAVHSTAAGWWVVGGRGSGQGEGLSNN